MSTLYRTQCRLPQDLAAWLKNEAKKEGRSMNAQLVWIAQKERAQINP